VNNAWVVPLKKPGIVEDGLTFRSSAELALYRAARRMQDRGERVMVFPNAGGRVPGRNVEVDLLVVYRGRCGVIEIEPPRFLWRL